MTRLGPALLCATLVVSCAMLLASCATPQMPSGGPTDSTPPEIVESIPAPDSVNVSGRTIRITFSEYVDEASFSRALEITPDSPGSPEISWSGRTVEVRLPEALRPNTTYVVTLDTELRDIRSVALPSPITFAFSSGPTISAGTLSGRVLLPQAGDPATGVDVFAYALPDSAAPDSLPGRPDYRTQTDQSGEFAFDFLTEQFYYVVALRDENRNRQPDPEEEYAAPPSPAVFADTVSVSFDVPWVMTRTDSTPPDLLRVQSLASSRHALRLSEPVRFVDRNPAEWELRDSTTGEAVGILDLYLQQDDPQQVFMLTPPLDRTTFTLRPAALEDTSGNRVGDQPVTFTPSAAEDTLQHRFQGFLPDDAAGPEYTLPRGVEPGVRFNAPIDPDVLSRAVSVVDSTGAALAFSAVTKDGSSYRLVPEPALEEGGRIEVHVDGAALAGPDSVTSAVYRRLPSSETGEVRGVATSDARPVVIQIMPVEVESAVPRYEVRADATGVFLFRDLPAGTYRLRAFGDRNEDGAWSGGMLEPYLTPEPIDWLTDPSRVRARWETSLPDTLRIREPR